MEMQSEFVSRSHVLRTHADWQQYKSFVIAYANKKFAYDILDGTEEKPPSEKRAEYRDYVIRSGELYFYMMSNLGPEYASAIQGTETRTCHAAWSKLSEIFEGKNIGSISLALRNLTTFTSAGSSASKFLSDTAILSGVLMSVIPEDMKIGDLIKLLEIQTILNGLNDEYDSLRITLRSQIDNLSLNEIKNRI